jgi:hypothetical protein
MNCLYGFGKLKAVQPILPRFLPAYTVALEVQEEHLRFWRAPLDDPPDRAVEEPPTSFQSA